MQGKVNKEVVPLFISYTDQTFEIYQYQFNDQNQYNSIELVKCGSYVLANSITGHVSSSLSHFGSTEFLKTVPPLLQANDIRKVIDTIFAISVGFDSKLEIAECNGFDERQSNYYANAARYLGFLVLENGRFKLTEEGVNYIYSQKNERDLMMVRAMMCSPTINSILKSVLENGETPDTESITISILLNRPELGNETAERRSHTIRN